MPISASSDPYDTTPGFEPASSTAKPFTDDLKEFDDDDDADKVDGGKVVGGEGVATSKVDPTEIDDDLARAGTGAGADPIDLAGIEKAVPPAGADADDDFGKSTSNVGDDDDDLDRAGTGAGTKFGADADLDGDLDDGLDGLDSDLDDDFVKGTDAEADDLDDGFAPKVDALDDDSLGADPSLKGAVDGDDFDEPDFVKHGPDDTDDSDDIDDIDGPDDKGDFLPFS